MGALPLRSFNPGTKFGKPSLPIADMAFAVTTKAQRGMSRRRTETDIRRAHKEGYIDHVPADSTVSRYLAKPELTPVLKWLIIQSALPLSTVEHEFAIDSSGIGSTTYSRWYDHKWGKEVRQVEWVKMHLLVGVKTKIVVAADVSESDANDSPFLKRLVSGHRGRGLRHKGAQRGQGVPLQGKSMISLTPAISTFTCLSRSTRGVRTPSGGAA